MSSRTVVIDYGIGNVFSVCRALEAQGANVLLSGDPEVIRRATRLVLPGVGAFGNGMDSLRARQLVEPLREAVAGGAHLLGICLGMQMLGSASEEFGEHEGLGLIPGRVVPLHREGTDGSPVRIPFVGWTAIKRPKGVSWDGTLLQSSREGDEIYTVHSFALKPSSAGVTVATYDVGGREVCAVVQHGRVLGTQFHPEKSGPMGLRMIGQFLAM